MQVYEGAGLPGPFFVSAAQDPPPEPVTLQLLLRLRDGWGEKRLHGRRQKGCDLPMHDR